MDEETLQNALKNLRAELSALEAELAGLKGNSQDSERAQKSGHLYARIETLREQITRFELEIVVEMAKWKHRVEEFKHQKRMNIWSRTIASIFVAGALAIGTHETLHGHESHDGSATTISQSYSRPYNPDRQEEFHDTAPKESKPNATATNSAGTGGP